MTMRLETSVQYIKGVGPKLGLLLNRHNIANLKDLLCYFPRSYEQHKYYAAMNSIKEGVVAHFYANLHSVRSFYSAKSQRRMAEMVIGDSTLKAKCYFFRLPFATYLSQFKVPMRVSVVGKAIFRNGHLEFHHPTLMPIEGPRSEEPLIEKDFLVPIYGAIHTLSSSRIQKLIDQILPHLESAEFLSETMPTWLRNKYDLPTLADSVKGVHQPPPGSCEEFLNFQSPYHKRLIFEEFFWFEILLLQRQQMVLSQSAIAMKVDLGLMQKIEQHLPYHLTKGQRQVLGEIVEDLRKPHPMHRLLHGDVGCGKTIVVFLAAALAISNDCQVALMAPTEILALQHFETAKKIFEPLGIRVALLISHQSKKERQSLLSDLASGQIALCIGTHALIQDPVAFRRLGLVVIDEQHRFGAYQRLLLKRKGPSPHFLVLSATPIPRTLAMTLYGDLNCSALVEAPQGRSPIQTFVVSEEKRDRLLGFIREELNKQHQVYVVYPFVSHTEVLTDEPSNGTYDAISGVNLWRQWLPETPIGLLHGKMSADEKQEVIDRFKRSLIKVLVTTSIVEVGIDVPAATVMVIEHSERFGLLQLHQLRGRVGRGSEKSFALLLESPNLNSEARSRLKILTEVQSGFEIAQKDLELRGPGEFMGVRQSGSMQFYIAKLTRDLELLKLARAAAEEYSKKEGASFRNTPQPPLSLLTPLALSSSPSQRKSDSSASERDIG